MQTSIRLAASSFTAIMLVAAAGSAHATTWSVPGDNSGTCTIAVPSCNTIADALAAAVDNDDISIAAGTYNESNLLVDKTLTITGAGSAATFVSPAGAIGFLPKANGITIQDLAIQNASDGIRIELPAGIVDDTTLVNLAISGSTSDGVELSGSTTVTHLTVQGCTFTGNNNGIRMASTSTVDVVMVTGSSFINSSIAGIYQANDGFSSTLEALHVSGSTFQGNSFAGVYAEEIRHSSIATSNFTGNGRGILIFKGFATSGVPVGNVIISQNTFTDSVNISAQVVIQAAATDLPLFVNNNTFNQNVGVLAANTASVDVRLRNSLSHSFVYVQDNDITLSGTFAAATAAYGIMIRGNGPVVASGNVMDGGGVGGSGTTPPTSGVYVRSVDASPNFGTIPATAQLQVECNRITGFENGVSIYDAVGLQYGGLLAGTPLTIGNNVIAGNAQAGVVNGASPTVNAENNYWGCAQGPGNAGCDDAVGALDVDPISETLPVCVACTENAECSDGNPCTQDTCNTGVCENAQEPLDPMTCLGSLQAQFQVKNSSDPSKNQMKWKWGKGELLDQNMLGAPNVDTEYALCVYDTSAGIASLKTTLTVDPSAFWVSKAPKGWNYKDKTGTSDGVTGVQLKTGAAEKAKAQVKARGLNIPMPVPLMSQYFDQDPSVVVQLISSEGLCLTSSFTAASKNIPTQFKAKAP